MGAVSVLDFCGKGVLWVLRSIYLFLAVVGRFVCGIGKPADAARAAPAIEPASAAAPAQSPRKEGEKEKEREEEKGEKLVRPEINHNHHDDEEEHAGATDDDSHGSVEAEAEEKEEEENEEGEEEEVQHGRETGCPESPGMFNDSMEKLVCCRLYGLLIDLTHEHGRGMFRVRVGKEGTREGGREGGICTNALTYFPCFLCQAVTNILRSCTPFPPPLSPFPSSLPEKHSELALSLPHGLTYQEFGKSFAGRLRKGGLEKMNSTQASPYYQLYRAYDREEGKCMPMIRRARLLEL